MREHKKTCLCASCLGKAGLLKDKNNGNYKDGRTLREHKCKEKDCENLITFNSKYYGEGRCRSCSKKGRIKFFSETHKKNISIGMIKSNHFNIRRLEGSLYIRKQEGSVYRNGYIMEKSGNDWVPQHRLIVERYTGRKLKKNEVVHHIDEDKHNNNPENLYVFKKRGLHSCFTQLVKYKIISLNILKSNLDELKAKENSDV